MFTIANMVKIVSPNRSFIKGSEGEVGFGVFLIISNNCQCFNKLIVNQ